jgi:DNA-binding NarL/FixJ family response regulator
LCGPPHHLDGTLQAKVPVARTRILLVDMPRMLSDIVSELLKEDPDCEVVGELRGPEDLLQVVQEQRPNVVAICLRETDLWSRWDRLFIRYPRLRILAFTPTGRRIGVFSESSREEILAALHAAPEQGGSGGQRPLRDPAS